MVSELETSKKQLLEIAKALHANAKLLILDEPTTALNNKEIDHLFSIVRRLRDDGKSFIFISHKMTEIFQIAGRYTVLRNGKMIQTGRIADITPTEVTKLMVGESYSDADIYAARDLGEPILEMENLSAEVAENSSALGMDSPSARAFSTTASANGCSLPVSTAAASARKALSVRPFSSTTTSVTEGWPRLRARLLKAAWRRRPDRCLKTSKRCWAKWD